jgi:hypothetical protein
VREQDARDYKEQDRLAALLEQPCDPGSIAAFPCSFRYCAVSLIRHNWQALIRAISPENALHVGYIIGEAMRPRQQGRGGLLVVNRRLDIPPSVLRIPLFRR